MVDVKLIISSLGESQQSVLAVQCWPDMGTVGRNNQLNVYIRVQAVQSTHLVVRGCQWK